MKKILAIVFIVATFHSTRLRAQEIFQFTYNFLNPIMMDGQGYAGHALGTNFLWHKMGAELEYARSGKNKENRYFYINPQLKFQFAAKDGSETSKYHYFTLGYLGFSAIKNTTFNGRGENLQPPYWDTLEGAQTYNDYHMFVKQKTSAIQVGYEKVTEKHISDVAFGRYFIVNSLGWLVEVVSGDGDDYQLDFTRTFRFSVFAAPPGWLKAEILGKEPAIGSYAANEFPQENVIIEPLQRNLIGARMSLQWTTLKPVGTSVGFEMTMVPGVFNRPGVYGWGFPDDNIYIKVNFGLAIGYSDKN